MYSIICASIISSTDSLKLHISMFSMHIINRQRTYDAKFLSNIAKYHANIPKS